MLEVWNCAREESCASHAKKLCNPKSPNYSEGMPSTCAKLGTEPNRRPGQGGGGGYTSLAFRIEFVLLASSGADVCASDGAVRGLKH